MTRSEISDLIARVQDAWSRRDVTALADFHAEDCVVESPVSRGAGAWPRGDRAIGPRRSFTPFPI